MISAALSQGGSSPGENVSCAPVKGREEGVDCVLRKSDATVFIKRGIKNLHVLVLRFDTKRAVGLKSGLPVIANYYGVYSIPGLFAYKTWSKEAVFGLLRLDQKKQCFLTCD
ncbi:hypothetical protein CEXT_472961 [Caerostris extrusa]|uniref:Uncharacterized protein n=1 Tax=Caerostris extrusa TaxID=172846 RepID=A0AAV4X7U6_CAEEX|nr:hypothetical protein CEXT_472961 [Caerostris extrusa]